MSVELANFMCRVAIAVSTIFIAIYLDKIQENIEFIRRNLNSINDEFKRQCLIQEIVMKLDRIANILDVLNKEEDEDDADE